MAGTQAAILDLEAKVPTELKCLFHASVLVLLPLIANLFPRAQDVQWLLALNSSTLEAHFLPSHGHLVENLRVVGHPVVCLLAVWPFVLGLGLVSGLTNTSFQPTRVQTALVWLLLLFHTVKGYHIHL